MTFAKETDLCAAFIAKLPEGWTAYPETGGFDIVVVRATDGFQIGIEAKLKLNAKVITQAAESIQHHDITWAGPDCRAVLIPSGVSMELQSLLPILGITCITMTEGTPPETASYMHRGAVFHPRLPEGKVSSWGDRDWYELAPSKRITLPDWIPDVEAGASAPTALTAWKIKAIKIAISLERVGFVTREDFKHFEISMSRWTQSKWIVKGPGGWVQGTRFPNLRAQHPVNYVQIEADFDKWKRVPPQPSLLQGAA